MTYQNGLPYIDGILGMSRNMQAPSIPISSNSFMTLLQQNGVIQSQIQAYYLQSTGSTLEIGGYSQSKIKNGQSLVYFTLSSTDNFWSTKIEGFRYGTSEKLSDGVTVSAYSTTPTYAILDTGTTMVYVPRSQYSAIVNLIFNGK